jgi:hypothetical protein
MDYLRYFDALISEPLEERCVDSEILSYLLSNAEEERVVASVESVHASRDAVRGPLPNDWQVVRESAEDKRLD